MDRVFVLETDSDSDACGTVGDEPRTRHQEDRHGDVVEIIDDVVEQGAVEEGDSFANSKSPRERAIAGIDRDCDRHHHKGVAPIIARDVVDGDEADNRSQGRVQMHGPRTSEQKSGSRHWRISGR